MTAFDVECDVLVAGSGAAGLTAAVVARLHGLKPIVVEKAEQFGGTSARSGGWLWIPDNPQGRAAGVEDSAAAARRYIQHEAGNAFDAETVDAFLAHGPAMVELLEAKTEVRFELGPAFSDYHAEAPGGLAGGRSICAQPYDGRALGAEIARLRPPLREITFIGMMIGSNRDLVHFFNCTRSWASARRVAVLLATYLGDLIRHGRPMRLTNGNALVARLARSAMDLGIPIWTSSPVSGLILDGERVAGATVGTAEGTKRIGARRGVVLAAGGFPHDLDRRRGLYPHLKAGQEHFSPTPESNTGDGIRMAEAVGGGTVSGYANPAAWVPVSLVPHADGTQGRFPHFVDRQKPGLIAVARSGRRFVNEANSYHDFISGLLDAVPAGEAPCAWLILDHATLRRYGVGFVKPFPVPYRHHVRSGYLKRGATLRELAAAAGIDASALVETVARFNVGAERGEDPEFGRGTTAYNRYLGDANHKPNPCVAPIAVPPFYAVKVVPGDLGTFAGLRTDGQARVLGRDARPIPGLYAAGNDMASVMGGAYPGGGITLGPAMTFAYVAARHMVGAEQSG
ncbi:MAG: FAD-dependent oxidoreductase [Alphaproteobacteria bacterium]|nr:FAD-dependent oxidoreductase [Alphaproteobacteria bacterium]